MSNHSNHSLKHNCPNDLRKAVMFILNLQAKQTIKQTNLEEWLEGLSHD